MKKTILILFNLTIACSCYAQLKVVIRGYSEDKQLKSIGVSPPLRDCINGWVYIDNIPVDSAHHFEKSINITKPTLIYLHCNDYAEAFVKPGDTININIKKLPAPTSDFGGIMQIDRGYTAILTGNHVYNNFFTLLEQKAGKMGNVPFLVNNELSDDDKRIAIKALYNQREKFLNDFIATNPGLDEQIKTQLDNEIKGQYFAHLLVPMHSGEKLNNNYLKDIENEDFSWNKVSTSQYMMQAAYNYYIYYLNNIPGENYSNKRLGKKYNNIKKYVTDVRLKNYFLTALMISLLDDNLDSYQEIFEDYKITCTNKEYINAVTKSYLSQLPKQQPGVSHLTDGALAIGITDVSGKTFPLSTLLNQYKNEIILVDFWASWCGPCIMQMPYLKKLEKKYKSKVAFISLSVDNNKNAWIVAMQKNKLFGNQYLINNPETSNAMKQELKIKTIPRFALLNSMGQVLNSDLPNPSENERVSKIINAALLSKQHN
jgi:thiol-disulfide isomerase/thioredoxin